MTDTTAAVAYRWSEIEKDSPMKLLERRRIIGEKAMLSEVVLRKGCFVPVHRHENEQFACILSGRIRFGIGEETEKGYETLILERGQVLHLMSNVPHSAEALEDTHVLDVFSPPSEKTGIDRGG